MHWYWQSKPFCSFYSLLHQLNRILVGFFNYILFKRRNLPNYYYKIKFHSELHICYLRVSNWSSGDVIEVWRGWWSWQQQLTVQDWAESVVLVEVWRRLRTGRGSVSPHQPLPSHLTSLTTWHSGGSSGTTLAMLATTTTTTTPTLQLCSLIDGNYDEDCGNILLTVGKIMRPSPLLSPDQSTAFC